jgi:hypothetical protein
VTYLSVILLLLALPLSADLIRVTPFDHSVFFADGLTYQNCGIEEACLIWPEICELERVDLFADIARQQGAECAPFQVRGQHALYLFGCPAPLIEEPEGSLPPGDVVPVPEPSYFVPVGLILLGVARVPPLRRW